MRTPTLITILSLLAFSTVNAQNKHQQHLSELIASENAFAKSAADSGVKKAFLMAFDPAGITFDAKSPVLAIPQITSQPENRKSTLYWYPANAAVSADGSLGFTMGPAVFKPDSTAEASSASYFFSAWKRNAQGKFKVMLDGGARRLKTADNYMEPKLTDGSTLAAHHITKASKVKTTIEALENTFNGQVNSNMVETYQKNLTDSAWVIRPGKTAAKDKVTGLQMINNPKITKWEYKFAGGGVAGSNDLAYAYGMVALTIKNKDNADQQVNASYIRTWQKLGKDWKIVGDMLSY